MQAAGERWVEGWRRAIDATKRHNARNYRLEIDRPATREEIREVENAIARPLPELFRKTLLEFSRRVDFFWLLGDSECVPEPLQGVFYGCCSWDIGLLARMYAEVRWRA